MNTSIYMGYRQLDRVLRGAIYCILFIAVEHAILVNANVKRLKRFEVFTDRCVSDESFTLVMVVV